MITALEGNKSLTRLNLRANYITDDGVVSLVELFRKNQTLKSLNIADNKILTNGAELLINVSSLKSLRLEANKIFTDGVRKVASAIKANHTLTYLDIADNGSWHEPEILIDALKFNSHLQEINLDWVPDSVLEKFSAEIVRDTTTLTSLILCGNEYTSGPSGMRILSEALKTNSSLTSINLYGNRIGNIGAEKLAEVLRFNRTLRILNLEANEIGNEGVILLADALSHNTTLTQLSLSSNNIGDVGAVALSEMLVHNYSLKNLNLLVNEIEEKGILALKNSLQINQNIEELGLDEKPSPIFKELKRILKKRSAFKKRALHSPMISPHSPPNVSPQPAPSKPNNPKTTTTTSSSAGDTADHPPSSIPSYDYYQLGGFILLGIALITLAVISSKKESHHNL